MWKCLSQIPVHTYHQGKDKERNSGQTPPKTNGFKGITLKEYFRICEEIKPNETLREIKQQSLASSNSSLVQTPSFNLNQQRATRRNFKTETCQIDHENQLRPNNLKIAQYKGMRVGNVQSLQKAQIGVYVAMKKKEGRKKVFTKIHSQSTKQQYQLLNRSTLHSFYQIQENKKKMLRKVQQQKERVNDLRLSDAFLITKYGSRFKIEAKAPKQE